MVATKTLRAELKEILSTLINDSDGLFVEQIAEESVVTELLASIVEYDDVSLYECLKELLVTLEIACIEYCTPDGAEYAIYLPAGYKLKVVNAGTVNVLSGSDLVEELEDLVYYDIVSANEDEN